MEKNRKTKILSIIALVLATIGMTLGFAAFSSTLSISSSATVTPNSNDFSVTFLGMDSNGEFTSESSIYPVLENGATGSSAIIVNGKTPYISNINVGFTEPGQVAIYGFYIKNTGKYMAYLRTGKIKLLEGMTDVIECSPSDGSSVTKELMDAACDSIDVKLLVVLDPENPDSAFFNPSLRNIFSFSGTDAYNMDSRFFIEPGNEMMMAVQMIYDGNGARADGDFIVKLASCEFEFSTVPGE